MRRAFQPLALCIAAAIAVLADGQAAPLDPDDCATLKEERAVLEQAGVRGNMAKGPQWAKANLPPDKLGQIQRLIELESQLLFRCSGQRLIELPAGVEADPAAVAAPKAKADDEAAEDPAKVEAPAPKGAQKPAPQKGSAAAKPKAAAKAKPKPKAKVDDAYKPPPSDPDADPFAGQLK
jgi:hypothetical protein